MNAREKTRILSMRDLRDKPTQETDLLNSTMEKNSFKTPSTDFGMKNLSNRNTGLSKSVKIQDEFIARLTEDSGTQLLEQEHEVSKFKVLFFTNNLNICMMIYLVNIRGD